MTKKTLQQYADETLDAIGLPQFKQPLKTIEEAFEANGWSLKITPIGVDISPKDLRMGLTAIAGTKYEFYDPTTGKFARDVTGPLGENFMAPDDVSEPDTRDVQGHPASVSWVVGVRAANDKSGDDPIEQQLAPRTTMAKELEVVLNGIQTEMARQMPTPGVGVVGEA